MGGGYWSVNTYQARVSQKQANNQDAFAYMRGASGVHPTLNPYGLEVRESRDSNEHPDSNPIIVGLDVSGSMGAVVRGIHKDLPQLLTLLNDRKYVPHPQIMFSAFSNGSCDQVPMQVGQFESDNRMDINLENMILGGALAGGCDSRESAELLLYLAARHTSTDGFEKRRRKGYLFIITDEMAYTSVKQSEIKRIFNKDVSANIPLDTIIEDARERYHLYVIIPTHAQGGRDPAMIEFWKSAVDPQHVILLENADDVSEAIALTIGLTERTITLEQGLKDVGGRGGGNADKKALSRALALVGGGVQSAGALRDDDDDNDGSQKRTKRL